MLPISDYDYHLPPELIAQQPAEPRDHSRLLVLPRSGEPLEHRHFYDIGRYLRPGDLVVANNSRVLPARLYGQKASGGRTEALLLRQEDDQTWEALVKGKVGVGTHLTFAAPNDPAITIAAEVTALSESGTRHVRFERPINDLLPQLGVMPLPPYITTQLANQERYQTVYSAEVGSAAAPTAGLHWTPHLIEAVRQQGVEWAEVTLHVGLDTFRPVQSDNALDHQMHREWYTLSAETAEAINRTRSNGGRVIAVGTTTVRVLETAGRSQPIQAGSGWTDIFIYPPYEFQIVDGLITNFHLPRSTLLLLVSALGGRQRILQAYQTAVEHGYRFFSFGDAMLII